MRNVKKILWGLILVAVGIILSLNRLGYTNIDLFFDGWWTLLIIIPSIISFITDEAENKVGDIIAIFIGVLLLLACQGYISFESILELALPFVIIVLGIALIFGGIFKSKIDKKIKTMSEDGLEAIAATFGENEVDRTGEDFVGANIDAVFGGVKLNLKEAKLEDETLIKASAIFGGITIDVPKDVKVVVKGTPLFGGISNHVKNKDAKKTIFITGFCMFGGIEIK